MTLLNELHNVLDEYSKEKTTSDTELDDVVSTLNLSLVSTPDIMDAFCKSGGHSKAARERAWLSYKDNSPLAPVLTGLLQQHSILPAMSERQALGRSQPLACRAAS